MNSRPIAEEAKDKKEGNDGGKKGAANVKTCALLLNNSASCGEPWIRKKKAEKKKEAAVTSHKDRPTWM